MILILVLFLFAASYQDCPSSIPNSGISTTINVNPLYTDLDEVPFIPLINEINNNSIQDSSQNQTIFQLIPLSITTFQFDFRHISNYSNGSFNFFDYCNQWQIAIVQKVSLDILAFGTDIQNQSNYATLPLSFTNNGTQKLSVYQFTLLAFVQLEFTLQMSLSESGFFSNNYVFLNTTKIINQVPYRALYNQSSIFAILLQASDLATLPMNPILWGSSFAQPNYIISYSTEDPSQTLQAQNQSLGQNYFSPNSIYWGTQSLMLLPYIPYFSNCQGYGQYIYLSQLIESPLCTLIDVNLTKPIDPYVFGDKAYGDTCVDLTIQCIVEETPSSPSGKPRWFELVTLNSLFSMIQDPLSSDQITNLQYDEASVLQIQLTNQIPSGQFATDVNLLISYYQVFFFFIYLVTKTQKRIIQGSITFANFYNLSLNQSNGSDPIYYNLIFNYLPLTQPALVNAFALGVPVYFILYLAIATLSVLQIVVFFLYHYILNRFYQMYAKIRNSPRPKIRVWQYAKAIYPSTIKGTIIALVPISTIYLLIALIMSGRLYTLKLPYASSLGPATDSDGGNAMVIFDLFKNNLKYTDPLFTNMRSSRCGVTCIICGLYLMVILTKIFVQEYDTKAKETQAYNGNIWQFKLWRRSQMFYTTIILTFFMLILVQFSFTNLYSNNSWYFLIGYKILQIFTEYILEEYFEDSMIVTPLASIMAIIIQVAMMGNASFYAFLFSYFIDVGTQMVERVYVMKIVEDTTDYLEKLYNKAIKMIQKLFDQDSDDEAEENGEKTLTDNIIDRSEIKDKEHEQINEDSNFMNLSTDSDSDIIFSDAFEENFASDDESISSYKFHSNMVNSSPDMQSSFTNNDLDDYEDRFKSIYTEEQKKKIILLRDEDNESISSLYKTEEENQKLQEVIIPYFENFAADILTLYQIPFISAIMWLLYDQSQWAFNYQISKRNFIFYVIWSLLLIPFQIVIDIIFYNLIEQYHGFDFLSYIENCNQRFEARKTAWIGQSQISSKVSRGLITIDQYCFSSQFYFIVTLYISATFLVIIGAQIIYQNNYGIFSDNSLIFICIFWYIMCVFVHKSFLLLGKKIGLWSIKNQERQVHPSFQESDEQMKSNIQNIQTTTDDSKIEEEKRNLIIPKWDNVIQLKETEVRLKDISNNLSQDQLITKQFRKLFITSNKSWLKDNIKQVFSPTTLSIRRKLILNSLTNIYGALIQNNAEEKAEKFDTQFEDTGPDESISIIKFNGIKITPQTQAILKYWLFRKRNLKKATSLIGGLMENYTKQYCEYCGLSWGLRANSEVQIEDMYLSYVKFKNINSIQKGQEIDQWQNFFKKKVRLITVCLICDGFLMDDRFVEKLKIRKQQRKGQFKKIARGVFYWLIFYRNRNR